MVLKCPDPNVANPLPPRLLEDESGWLSRLQPITKPIPYSTDHRYKANDTGDSMEMIYNDITNSHPSENVTVTVEVSILARTSGSHSCELTVGSSTVNLTYEAVDVTGLSGESAYSETTIEPVYRSNVDVYAGESIALELDVTLPPWWEPSWSRLTRRRRTR